jgi:hypothetical protein
MPWVGYFCWFSIIINQCFAITSCLHGRTSSTCIQTTIMIFGLSELKSFLILEAAMSGRSQAAKLDQNSHVN